MRRSEFRRPRLFRVFQWGIFLGFAFSLLVAGVAMAR